jgi:hypothetical protein
MAAMRVAKTQSHAKIRFRATHSTVILRSRALARRLEGCPGAPVAYPSRLAVKNGEHLRMTAVLYVHALLRSQGRQHYTPSATTM